MTVTVLVGTSVLPSYRLNVHVPVVLPAVSVNVWLPFVSEALDAIVASVAVPDQHPLLDAYMFWAAPGSVPVIVAVVPCVTVSAAGLASTGATKYCCVAA